MKRTFFLLAFAFMNAFAFSGGILGGIWQGDDRLVMFEDGDGGSFDFAVVLRVFYGWYDDRAAEGAGFSEIRTRDTNDAESALPEDISVSCRTVFENPSKTAGVYELTLSYPSVSGWSGKTFRGESAVVPVAVIDGKLYLDFLVSTPVEGGSSGGVWTDGKVERGEFWRCASNADGITISPPRFKKEVRSFFVNKRADGSEDVYRLRYWKSGMEFSGDAASFSDGESVFSVGKFLRIGNDVYQCTTGRSTKIRNIEKTVSMPSGAVFDSDRTICALGGPYLVKVPGEGTRDELLAAVDENNARRRPLPKPLFPPSKVNFRWKEISELEKYNPFTWNRRNIDLFQ